MDTSFDLAEPPQPNGLRTALRKLVEPVKHQTEAPESHQITEVARYTVRLTNQLRHFRLQELGQFSKSVTGGGNKFAQVNIQWQVPGVPTAVILSELQRKLPEQGAFPRARTTQDN